MNVVPLGTMPSDGDALSVASVAQRIKVALDGLAWTWDTTIGLIVQLRTLANEWTGLNIFDATLKVLGNLAGVQSDITPNVLYSITAAGTWKLVDKALDTSNNASAMPYRYVGGAGGAFAGAEVFGNNTIWDPGTAKWACIDTTANATRMVLSTQGWTYQYHVATATPWVEGSWASVLDVNGVTDVATFINNIVSTNGKLTLGAHRSSATPGAGQSMAVDTAYADTLAFAWGIVLVNPAGPSISLSRGVNVASVSRNAAGQYDVTLQTAAAHVLVPIVTPLVSKAAGPIAMTVDSADGVGPTTTTFRVLSFSASNTLADVPGTGNEGFYFVCFQG